MKFDTVGPSVLVTCLILLATGWVKGSSPHNSEIWLQDSIAGSLKVTLVDSTTTVEYYSCPLAVDQTASWNISNGMETVQPRTSANGGVVIIEWKTPGEYSVTATVKDGVTTVAEYSRTVEVISLSSRTIGPLPTNDASAVAIGDTSNYSVLDMHWFVYPFDRVSDSSILVLTNDDLSSLDSIDYRLARKHAYHINILAASVTLNGDCGRDVWIDGNIQDNLTVQARNIDVNATLGDQAQLRLYAKRDIKMHPGFRIDVGGYLRAETRPCIFVR